MRLWPLKNKMGKNATVIVGRANGKGQLSLVSATRLLKTRRFLVKRYKYESGGQVLLPMRKVAHRVLQNDIKSQKSHRYGEGPAQNTLTFFSWGKRGGHKMEKSKMRLKCSSCATNCV